MKKTGAVLLAAGMSSRMGAFKPVLPFGRTSVIGCTIDKFKALGISPILVVTGYRAEELEAHLSCAGVRFAKNERYQATQTFESARIGIEGIVRECDRLLLLPADLPTILPETLSRVLREEAPLLRPVCRGHAGHPVLLSSGTAEKLCEYPGEGSFQEAIRHFSFPVTLIEVEDEGIYRDMDTWDQYQALLQLHNEHKRPCPIRPKVTLRLVSDTIFYGPGVQELLYGIHQNGSLQKACIAMNMSYSKGAKMVKNLERRLGYSVVERYAGGVGGGGSRLTERGVVLMGRYEACVTEIQDTAAALFLKYFHDI